MAVTQVVSPTFTATMNAANDYLLPPGWTGPTSPVSRWVIQIANTGTFNGTVTVKARLADGNNATLLPVPYYALNVNGTVGAGPNQTANLYAGAAAGNTLIEVDASEMEVSVSCTAYTSGSATLTARLLQG